MKILLIHQIFVTPEEGGGTRHFELGKFLTAKGHKVTVIASDVDYLSGKKKSKKMEVKDGVNIIYSYTYSGVHKSFLHRAFSFFTFSLTSFVNALKEKEVNIVWGTSPPLFQSITAFVVAKLKKKPFVFEVRDLWLDFAKELGIVRNKILLKIFKFLEIFLYKNADKIIVNSPGFIPFIKKYIDEEKIVLIPNGVITKEFEVSQEVVYELREQLKLNKKFVVLYAGNIGVANDIETIIETARFLKSYDDILFLLIGGGIKKNELHVKCEREGLNNVVFLGTIPKRDIPKYISIADVCVATLKNIPLFKTTYPNKVFDYMAAGKPVILAIDGVIRKVVEDANAGMWVEPGNAKQMRDAVLRYYHNRTLLDIHGKNGKIYVKNFFEREKIADNLEQIFKELIS